MSEKLNLLEKGQKKCHELLSKYPSSVALQSVGKQIEYLIALEKGVNSDCSLLKDITIGVLTAREIEQLDDDAAEIFYRIASASR
ncbi:immunity protein Tsi6 family protein [Pseudomonas capsici]|uniref:immunity protein Tsi6 family protein n=1 Tax=Pseudomonas capsici TaxID=2810614 RepID=UPI0021F1563F|nr:immunity protein Tsi6 family protein [Pseudomonas capsici]MCV4274468.1 immunity protein Tsi6 family protein [Pseudomonas capsici]